jgi:VanZ family protein
MQTAKQQEITVSYLYKALFIVALGAIYLLAVLPGDSLPGVQLWDKLQHAMAFFVLAVLLAMAWPEAPLWRVRLLGLMAYGVLIELSQSLLPYRDASLLDLFANACGLLLFAMLAVTVQRRRAVISR